MSAVFRPWDICIALCVKPRNLDVHVLLMEIISFVAIGICAKNGTGYGSKSSLLPEAPHG